MWFIFDNLRASMIAGAVLLMLLTAMTRTREMGVEQLSVYSAKSHSLDLAEWLGHKRLDEPLLDDASRALDGIWWMG